MAEEAHNDVTAVIAQRPGALIEGLGQIPELPPYPDHNGAYAPYPGSPRPELLEQIIDIHQRHGDDVELACLDRIGAKVAHAYPELSSLELREIVGFYKATILSHLPKVAASIPEDLSRAEKYIRDDTSQALQTAQSRKREYYEWSKSHVKTNDYFSIRLEWDKNAKEYRDIQRTPEERTAFIEEQCALGMERLREETEKAVTSRLNDIHTFSWDGIADLIQTMYSVDLANLPQDPTPEQQLAAHLRRAARRVYFQVMGEMKRGVNSVYYATVHGWDMRHLTDDETPHHVAAIIDEKLPSLVSVPSVRLSMIREFTDKIRSPFEQASVVYSPAVPVDYALRVFTDATPHYDPNPGTPQATAYLSHAFADHEQPPFETILGYLTTVGRLPATQTEALAAWSFYENHRSVIHDTKRFIRFAPLYDAQSDHDAVLNLRLVNPCFPSQEALRELKPDAVNEPMLKLPPNLLLYVTATQAMAQAEGYDPQIWLRWARKMKQPFLAALSRSERRRVLYELLEHKKNPSDDPKDSYERDTQQRLPNQHELFEQQAGFDRARAYENLGKQAWRHLVVPVRLDRDENLGKYRLTPHQVLSLYESTYDAMTREFIDDPYPHSWACGFRSALYKTLAGPYEQYYRGNWPGYEAGGSIFDELDALLFLPSVAAENNYDPGFLMIATKLLVQMDADIRERYEPEIMAALQKLTRHMPDVRSYMDIGGPPPRTSLGVNLSHHAKHGDQMVARAMTIYENVPVGITVDPKTLPWTDPDIALGPKGELIPMDHHETRLVAPGQTTTIERVASRNASLGSAIERISENHRQNVGAGALVAGTSLAEMLTATHAPGDNVPVRTANMDRIIQAAACLPGADRDTLLHLLQSLHEPLSPEHLTPQGKILLTWMLAGHIEPEAVALANIMGTAAAFRVSVRQMLAVLDLYRQTKDMTGLEALGYTQKEARQEVQNTFAFTYLQLRDQLASTLSDLPQLPQPRETIAIRTFIEQAVHTCAAELARVSSYHYKSTQWGQLIDQVFGKGIEHFLTSDGQLRLYCVQQSYILHELLQELLLPLADASARFTKPLAITLALEDAWHGLTAQEYFDLLAKKKAGQPVPDNLDHFYVLVSLPTTADEPQLHLLVDPTKGTTRLFSDRAIREKSPRALTLDNSRTKTSDTGRTVLHDIPKRTTRLILAQNAGGDVPLTVIADLMDDLKPLGRYGEFLDHIHPNHLVDICRDARQPIQRRHESLLALMHGFPYFLGESGFSIVPASYETTMLSLLSLCRTTDEPIVGLFIARTLALNSPGDTNHTLSESFIRLCALTPSSSWKHDVGRWNHLLTTGDDEAIRTLRETYAKNSEAERIALNKHCTLGLADHLSASRRKATEKQTTQLHRVEKEDQATAGEPGSRLRSAHAMQQVEIGAAQATEASEQNPDASTAIVDARTVASPSGAPAVRVGIRTPIALTDEVARQAADFLLLDCPADAIDEAIQTIAARLRTFVMEAHPDDPAFQQAAWTAANHSISAALTAQNIPTTATPLDALVGSREAFMQCPKEEVLRRIRHDLTLLPGQARAMLRALY